MSAGEPSRERALDALRTRYAREAPFAQDRACADELAREAAPVLEALAEGLSSGGEGHRDAELHEALAMATLLGRRAAGLGVTPTALLALAGGLEDALASTGVASPSLVAMLRGLLLEGWAQGREERFGAEGASRAASAIPLVRVARGCLALFVAGRQEAEAVRAVVDELGRVLLAEDAKACIVDVEHLEAPTRELAAEVFAADVGARMLGVPCWFTGVSPALRDLATSARVPLEVLRFEPRFADALPRALGASGHVLRPEGALASLLRRR